MTFDIRACGAGTSALFAALITASGCSSYDSGLLNAVKPSSDASTSNGDRMDGSVRPVADASTHDASGVPPDLPLDGGGPDAASDASGRDGSATVDAGCGALNPSEDCCPDDATKTEAGQCGCGVPETDGDADGTADCIDSCPSDSLKTEPGICGCERADSDVVGAAVASCAGLSDALVHRYRFDGSGAAVTDARGTAHGVLLNTQLTDTGTLTLAGGTSDQYVDLPNGLISSLTDATIEVWVTWTGSSSWERIFDFGNNNNATEGNQGTGRTYLFLTPRNAGGGGGALRVAYSVNGSGSETGINATAPLSNSGMHHVAVVIDDTNDQMLLYVDGTPAGWVALTGSLSAISDINGWLGRSQYSSDPELTGSLHELRIYNTALTAAQLALSFADGADPAYLEP